MRIAICDDSIKALKLLSFNSLIKFIIVFDENFTDELKNKANQIGVQLLSFEDVKLLGRTKIHPVQVIFFNYLIN